MRAEAGRFAPQGGKGFWENDAAFFDSGSSGKWQGLLDDTDLDRYAARMAELVPNERARRWLEAGGEDLPGKLTRLGARVRCTVPQRGYE
jgi:aryl sulfotransferase